MKRLRVFVTGTDTGVGKTQVSCALLSLLADLGRSPAPMKPYESGCSSLTQPADALEMIAAARSSDPLDLVCPHRFKAPLAPGVAAARLGREPSFEQTMTAFRAFARRDLVMEGAGGLLVPIDAKRDVVDLIEATRLPVVLVARAGLGTLNHTGLSLELLARRRIPVSAVVLSRAHPAPKAKDPSERDNAEWIARRHNVQVLGPVSFVEDASRRRAAFKRALRPLVEGL